jgi:hypothetical protein
VDPLHHRHPGKSARQGAKNVRARKARHNNVRRVQTAKPHDVCYQVHSKPRPSLSHVDRRPKRPEFTKDAVWYIVEYKEHVVYIGSRGVPDHGCLQDRRATARGHVGHEVQYGQHEVSPGGKFAGLVDVFVKPGIQVEPRAVIPFLAARSGTGQSRHTRPKQ